MADDIVAELDRWLRDYRQHPSISTAAGGLLMRLRDEIVALRDEIALGYSSLGIEACAKARAEALEEAAQVCETLAHVDGAAIAITIRALKENPGAA